MLNLRPARASESKVLSELCLRSKAVWGYDDAFMTACREELALTPEKIAGSFVQVAELDGDIAGVVQVSMQGDNAELEALFVEPAIQRSGVGRALFDWAVRTARLQAAKALLIEADPGAAEFYRRMGARDTGTVPSGSIPGRFIPRLKLPL